MTAFCIALWPIRELRGSSNGPLDKGNSQVCARGTQQASRKNGRNAQIVESPSESETKHRFLRAALERSSPSYERPICLV